jgi:transmembrane sensor
LALYHALAAGIAILGVALVYFGGFRYQIIDTAAGERRAVTFADGSIVAVSPETTLRVHFTKNERHVTLSRGDEVFHVAKDPAKPFLMESDRTRARAVGTAFGVEHRDDAIIVTVEEGRVAVAQAPTESSFSVVRRPPVAEISLDADQQIMVPQAGSMEQVRKVDSRRELAWADGHLVFDHDSVAEVVQPLQSRSDQRARPAARHAPGKRGFNVSDPEAFVTFLESVTNSRVTRPSRNMIVIVSGAT